MNRRRRTLAIGVVAVVVAGAVVVLRPTGAAPVAARPVAVAPVAVVPIVADPKPSATAPVPTPTPSYADVLDGPPPGPEHDQVPAHTAAPADRWAFVVGVTAYRAPTHDTVGGAGDAAAVQTGLLAAGWLPDHVRVLTDGAATGAAVRDGLAWLAEHGTPGTFTFFHWSGHVKMLGGTTEGLWPVDADYVTDTQVTGALARVQGHLWVDIAGCEADSFSPGLPGDRVLFSGSSELTEKSYEYPAWKQSVWSGLVFTLGIAQRQADADGDGRVTIGESLRYATYYAQKITRDQQPYGRQTPQVEGDPVRGWTLDAPPA